MSTFSSSSKNMSRRSLTFNKSFLISLFIHGVLIFGISITTYYKLPIFNESPIINVKLANSNQDYMNDTSIDTNMELKRNMSSQASGTIQTSKNSSQSFKIKKLQANSVINSQEAVKESNLKLQKKEEENKTKISNDENIKEDSKSSQSSVSD